MRRLRLSAKATTECKGYDVSMPGLTPVSRGTKAMTEALTDCEGYNVLTPVSKDEEVNQVGLHDANQMQSVSCEAMIKYC